MLTVATTLPAPGFWEGDDVTIVGGGYEWGLARSLADEFDLDLKVIDVPFADLVAGDLEGADMALAQIEITEERREVLDFSLPYFASDFGVLMLAGETAAAISQRRGSCGGPWSTAPASRPSSTTRSARTQPVHVVTDDVAAAEAITAGERRRGADRPVERADPGARRRSPRRRGEVRHRRRSTRSCCPKGSVNLEKVDAALRGFQRDGTLRNLADDLADPALLDVPRRRARDRARLSARAARPGAS